MNGKPEPGDGWRTLAPHETIENGDEFWLLDRWEKSSAFGEITRCADYRRRVEPQRWIPFSERKPDGSCAIWAVSFGRMYYLPRGATWEVCQGWQCWQPAPEPPEPPPQKSASELAFDRWWNGVEPSADMAPKHRASHFEVWQAAVEWQKGPK